ncbi:MAG TPA: helix-turn-helix domain-containing protein [Ktedonobacterales bacterium]|nr:helix-turn-helix domain-containing protein [Ktedonobacterales bacterium]
MSGPVTVRETLPHLTKWGALLIAGEHGLGRAVSWASVMRAQLPAFQDLRRGELAVLSLATVQALQDRGAPISLLTVLNQLAELGASGAIIAGLTPVSALPRPLASTVRELRARADQIAMPLIALPQQAPLADVRAAIVALAAERRDRPASPLEPVDAYAAQLRSSLRSEALEVLLAGAYVGEAQMRMRASHLGYDLNQPHVVLWVQARGGARGGARSGRRDDDHDLTRTRALAETLEVALGAWTQVREPDQVIALLPLGPDRSPQDVAERVTAHIARTLGDEHDRRALEWSAGLGEPATAPAQVHRSAQEAHDAAQLGAVVLGPRHVARQADLGVYRLLLTLSEQGELEPFTRHALEPLLRDHRHGDTLIETLDAFFACNGNSTKAAEKLHLHRNSLLYRLNQARALLGQDLDDPETRLALQLAIKGLRVLHLKEEQPTYD